MGYLLTEQHQIPHGNACALFLPDFLQINEEAAPGLTNRYYEEIGSDKEEILALLASLLEGVSVVISEEEIVREHSRWAGNGSIAKTRGDITPEMCDEVLRRLSEKYF